MRKVMPVLALLLPTAGSAYASEAFGDDVYYIGDLHAHTGYSGDAGATDLGNCIGSCGNVADVFATAKSNGLDFLAIADHVNGSSAATAANWSTLNAAVIAANDPPGGFVTLPAAELWFIDGTSGTRLGHKTLLMFGDDTTLSTLAIDDVRFRGAASTVTACDDIWTWMSTLTAGFGDAILIPHHTAATMPMPTDWDCHSDDWEPAVEIYSEHGNSLEDTSGYDQVGDGVDADGTAVAAMDPDAWGYQFGFVGGTDSHDTLPGEVCELDTEHPTHLYAGGLTMVVLDGSEALDRDTIRDAIDTRRTYVTTGPALPMQIGFSVLGVDVGRLGDELDLPASEDLDVAVSIPADRAAYVTAVDVIGPDRSWYMVDDGAGNWTGTLPARTLPEWVYIAVEIDGAAWYGGTACDDGGDDTEWLWSSPSFISVWEDDTDSDGVSVLGGDCDDSDATVYPGATEVWYDGVDQDCAEDGDYDQDADGDDSDAWGGGDCDDTDATISSVADETWYDGVDQDCDGADDFDQDGDGQELGGLDCDDTDAEVYSGATDTWYDGVDTNCDGANDYDQDGDGAEPAFWAGGDCDDTDASTYPGAEETWYDGVDQDCDGADDFDQDGDGVDYAPDGGGDCDDTDPAVHPGATEVWYDGVDADCDGVGDWDQDGDGHDAVPTGADCDDANPTVSPDAVEAWYDGVDQNCDGASDYDADGDGADALDHGGDDCDDLDATVNPGAEETWYDGIDQDCDGRDDDADGDGLPREVDCDDDNVRIGPCASTHADTRGCISAPGQPWALGAWAAALMIAGVRRRK